MTTVHWTNERSKHRTRKKPKVAWDLSNRSGSTEPRPTQKLGQCPLLTLSVAGMCNLEIASKHGLGDRETPKLHSHFHDNPITKAQWGLGHIRGLDPVQCKIRLREFRPPAQGLPEGAELTEEMLSISPLTTAECLLCAWHYAKHFSYFSMSFNAHLK